MLCTRPVCDFHLLLLASSHCSSLKKDLPHFPTLPEARFVPVFVWSLATVVQIVYSLAVEAGLQMVLVVAVASGRCF